MFRPIPLRIGNPPCVTEAARIAESRFPGDLDYNSFFLDDGVIAGRSPAVQQIIATSVQNFSPHDFEGFAWVPDGNIKLLGAAIGSQSWCKALLKRRVVKARNLLDATGRYPDAQGAFTLPRPPLQAEGLSQADQDIRHSPGRLVGSSLSDDDWRVASIGVANGGLAARSAFEHAPAAYVSSLAQTQLGFDEYDLDGGSDVKSSLGAFFLPNAGLYNCSGTPSQKSLSAKIEAKVCHHLLDPSSHDSHRVAQPQPQSYPWGRSVAFLPFLIPSIPHPGTSISGQLTSSPPHASLDPRHQLHSLRPGHGQMG